MKSKIIFLALLFATAVYLPSALPVMAASLTVNSPASGQLWAAGSTQTISWSLSNQAFYQSGQAQPTIFIQLNSAPCAVGSVSPCANTNSVPYIVAENIPNTGSYQWAIPAQINFIYQGQVTLTVGLSDSSAQASSNQFYLVAPNSYLSSVPLVSPNGGQQWPIGSSQTISWSNASSTIPNVNINLVPINLSSCGNSPCMATATSAYIIASNAPNNGSYSWYINNSINGQVLTPGTYAVSLTDPATGNAVASSAGIFTLLANPQAASAVSATSTPPNISGLNPNSGSIGQPVNIIGSGFTATGNSIQFGPGNYINGISSANGTSLQFTVPAYSQPCPANNTGACPFAVAVLGSGAYGISVSNANGVSNTMPFEVTGNSQTPTTTPPDLTINPQPPIIFPDGALVTISGSPTVYLVNGGQLMPFTSAAIFLSRGYQWMQVQSIASGQINPQYISTSPVLAANGSIIKTTDNPTVYLIVNGQKSAIPSLAVFNSLGLNFTNLITISDQELQNYPSAAAQQ